MIRTKTHSPFSSILGLHQPLCSKSLSYFKQIGATCYHTAKLLLTVACRELAPLAVQLVVQTGSSD